MDAVKKAVFAAGAGRYPGPGNYTECAWSTIGTGQFRPGDTANPHIGEVGALEKVEEARVETLCICEECARKSVKALKKWVPSSLSPCIMLLVSFSKIISAPTGLIHTKNLATKSTRSRTFDPALIIGAWDFTFAEL